MKSKKAAMEMSVGTIVTIVLLMSFLVLGIFLLQKIFKSGHGAIDMTDDQLRKEIQSLFSDSSESRVVIIPNNQILKIKQGDMDEIGIGITNRLLGSDAGSAQFAYDLNFIEDDLRKCGITETAFREWLSRAEADGIRIPIGTQAYNGRIRIELPDNAPLCTIGLDINVWVDEDGDNQYTYYVSSIPFDLKIV